MRPALVLVVVLPLAVASLPGCPDRELAGVDPVVQTVIHEVSIQPPSGKVDIVVVVDRSGSMREEQAALAANFPALIEELMAPSDPDLEPVTDLHVGVISTDLGSGGFEVDTCNHGALGYAGGDDGCFQHNPMPGLDCAATYPLFLERDEGNAGSYPLERMGDDFGCIATLGTNGCGFEQQMAAAKRALVDQTVAGGCNAGFLRDDAILAVLWVTDEEDCSAKDPGIFDPDDHSLACMNARCYVHQEYLYGVDELIAPLRALKPNPNSFVLAMLAGVPVGGQCEGKGEDIAGCLALPEMQYQFDPTNPCDLLPSCVHPEGWGRALPPRRLVQAAMSMGERSLVRSICNEDWAPVMDAVLELIEGAIRHVCFPHELAFDPRTCRTDCDVIEILPDDQPCGAGRIAADPPTETDEAGRVRRRCVIPQAERPVQPDGTCGATPAGEGWYYLRAEESAEACNQVRFTEGAVPAPNSRTQLECLSYVCPAERRCGGASNPGGRCCADDEVCVDVDPLTGGTCASP